MNKFISLVTFADLGLVTLAVAGPTLTRLIAALVPLVLVAGIVAAVLRLVWSYTRKW